jgi:hypothetical protein
MDDNRWRALSEAGLCRHGKSLRPGEPNPLECGCPDGTPEVMVADGTTGALPPLPDSCYAPGSKPLEPL